MAHGRWAMSACTVGRADSATTTTTDLTPYMNYLSFDTGGSQIDWVPTAGSDSVFCTVTTPCMRLHNGAAINFWNVSFAGTGNLNAIYFIVDPDGAPSGVNTGPGKAVEFILYYNGRLATYGTHVDNTVSSAGTRVNAIPAYDPGWFRWN